MLTAQMMEHSEKTLSRLLPRLEKRFKGELEPVVWEAYSRRLIANFPQLFGCLHHLYGHLYDFFFHVESILISTTELWIQRDDELKALDALREMHPDWFQSHRMVGATCYVDLFARTLHGLKERVGYLKELGITYLHLMPLFNVPEGDNDGGYAVSDYRQVDPRLGTMEDLSDLARLLRHHGISLCIDFVFNHTSEEHEWAQRALNGEKEYQDFFLMFPDRTQPDAFDKDMLDVFPEDHVGAFTYRNRIKKWVWTTFHNYQWDLNYQNPVVFNRMTEEMLFLANQGVEVIRLDAVAFLWKRLGTNCQNLPEAHIIIQAFSALARVAAPAIALKSEAIVHPDEVNKYISRDECQLSYNPQLMALIWNSLATRDIRILRSALEKRFRIPNDCGWVNYVRCHDDIGWTITNEDIAAAGYDPNSHRKFLADFYVGRFPGSFARGQPFQENAKTGDARVSGMTASLAGLEVAMQKQDEHEIELAILRILLIHGVIMTIGGIPLVYLGDEIAMFNDYSYNDVSIKHGDSRWLHRPQFDWQRATDRDNLETPVGKVFQGMLRMITLRKQNLAFDRGETEFVDTGNDHVFGFFRNHNEHSVLVLANFTEQPQAILGQSLRRLGLRKSVVDMMAGQVITASSQINLDPYQFVVLARPR